jgi:hypothetical protein
LSPFVADFSDGWLTENIAPVKITSAIVFIENSLVQG